MKYEILTVLDQRDLPQFHRLVMQLSTNASLPELDGVNHLLTTPGLTVFVARSPDGTLCGMLSLVYFEIPTGLRARIEDVVVLEDFRRKGIARQLSSLAIAHFRASGARTLDLTSNPSREAANKLYVNLGFKLRSTNVYRFSE
jgi:ribosomal protein S18 acetylase RimI-like enzyme